MYLSRLLSSIALMLVISQLCACSIAYGIYDDKRLIDTMTNDKKIAADVKTTLMGNSMSEGWAISVFCYYGKVFLAGEVPPDMRSKALAMASKCKGVVSVTPHWFTARTGENSDIAIATKVRTTLITTEGLSSTRIDTTVNANRVALFGVVNDERERALAIKAARLTDGVKEVSDYLMLPQ